MNIIKLAVGGCFFLCLNFYTGKREDAAVGYCNPSSLSMFLIIIPWWACIFTFQSFVAVDFFEFLC